MKYLKLFENFSEKEQLLRECQMLIHFQDRVTIRQLIQNGQ